LGVCLLLIIGLLAIVLKNGLTIFWPHPLVALQLKEGAPVLGIQTREEKARRTSSAGESHDFERYQFKVGNRDLYNLDFRWIDKANITNRFVPSDAVLIERLEYGDFYGFLKEVRHGTQPLGQGAGAYPLLQEKLEQVHGLVQKQKAFRNKQLVPAGKTIENAKRRLTVLQRSGKATPAQIAEAESRIVSAHARFEELNRTSAAMIAEAQAFRGIFASIDGKEKEISLAEMVRVIRPNAMSATDKIKHYCEKLWEFVSAEPRESNTEGGIFPAIFGTVMMTMLMSVAVVPFGVLAALYLREYASQGLFVRFVRIAVNNLAGVPSIVYGVFGLGFFVYFLGGTIDQLFYSDRLPNPTFGTGGILWASLTLALLTVPVVIVATEEAIAAVPRGAREGSLALGASKFQTIWNIILPASTPGILTGLILAMARGAGEVAPLMITGVVKLAPNLPIDAESPFLHLERKFMHLAFHIYDVGFQSPNVEAAKPMVFTTTLLLLAVVIALNLAAIILREKIRKRYKTGAFA
jgi:phosphate transport system permease protein